MSTDNLFREIPYGDEIVRRLAEQDAQNELLVLNSTDIDQEAAALQRDPTVIWGWVGGIGVGLVFCAGLLFFPKGVAYFLAALGFLVPFILCTAAFRRSLARARLNRSTHIPAYFLLLLAVCSLAGILWMVLQGIQIH